MFCLTDAVYIACGQIDLSTTYRSIKLCNALNSNERHSYVIPLSHDPDTPSATQKRKKFVNFVKLRNSRGNIFIIMITELLIAFNSDILG